MKYLMLVVADGKPSEDPTGDDIVAWVTEMDNRGIRLFGNRVVSPDEATTVQVRDGEVLLTDGPYAETREQMAGFDIIECGDLDQAIEVAARHPMARHGRIEVRPFWRE
ncbi:YciI family protein [Dactylosporangium siamense]|uniref:YciI family protein n=1 Tax=Dactylosporangium siamense TaxID=685454 RepID=UPI001942B69D|nr:YciI family protein [Dactylosporangium siamense]